MLLGEGAWQGPEGSLHRRSVQPHWETGALVPVPRFLCREVTRGSYAILGPVCVYMFALSLP